MKDRDLIPIKLSRQGKTHFFIEWVSCSSSIRTSTQVTKMYSSFFFDIMVYYIATSNSTVSDFTFSPMTGVQLLCISRLACLEGKDSMFYKEWSQCHGGEGGHYFSLSSFWDTLSGICVYISFTGQSTNKIYRSFIRWGILNKMYISCHEHKF